MYAALQSQVSPLAPLGGGHGTLVEFQMFEPLATFIRE
jgi:hypothetical protein